MLPNVGIVQVLKLRIIGVMPTLAVMLLYCPGRR